MFRFEKIVAEQVQRALFGKLSQIVRRRATESGIQIGQEAIDTLVSNIFAGIKEPLLVDGEDIDIVLKFSEQDEEEILSFSSALRESIPDLVNSEIKRIARAKLKETKINWQYLKSNELAQKAAFQHNLRLRWGDAINGLELLIVLARQFGYEYSEKSARSKRNKNSNLRDVMVRIHARSCQIASEILMLLENGYADGAMARWRTLHELNVVMKLIIEGGDALALRYKDHEIVESKRAMDGLMRHYIALGVKPVSRRELTKMNKEFDAIKSTYGAEFCEDYGWAAQFLGIKRPKFAQIEQRVGYESMRPKYKYASYNVHASIKGLTLRLGCMGDRDLILAGASNAGLDEVGIMLAFSIADTTFNLFGPRYVFDDVVTMKMLKDLSEETIKAFSLAGRKLERDSR